MIRRFAIAVVMLIAAAVVWVLPPRPLESPPVTWTAPPSARGAYHIHSAASDGTGTIDEIAAAAARAGLQFVILTDHGNGTRPPLVPEYRSGVLCIDGVEISTEFGHLVAIGTGQSSYPLAGHPGDVLEDVHRLGGIGFAAHPGSPKEGLRWHEWSTPVDGLEWLNADSEWRDEGWEHLVRGLLTYPFRPAESLATLLDRPTEVLQRWQTLTRDRRVVGVAAADAHARVGFRQGSDPYTERVIAQMPSYEVSFRAFSNHVLLERPLTQNAATDAALVLDGIRGGRVYTIIDSLASRGALEFTATNGAQSATLGDYLEIAAGTTLRARWSAPPDTTVTAVKDGQPIATSSSDSLQVDIGSHGPGAYRLEGQLANQTHGSVPWLLTNAIYVGLREAHADARRSSRSDRSPPAVSRSLIDGDWQPEMNPESASRIERGGAGSALVWHFRLAGGVPHAQYSASRLAVGDVLGSHQRVHIRARASRPMRIWIQLRSPSTRLGERWGRTIYLDEETREQQFELDSFRPIGTVSQPKPPLHVIDGLLLVVDTLNSLPGNSGTITIEQLALIADKPE